MALTDIVFPSGNGSKHLVRFALITPSGVNDVLSTAQMVTVPNSLPLNQVNDVTTQTGLAVAIAAGTLNQPADIVVDYNDGPVEGKLEPPTATPGGGTPNFAY